MPIKLHFVLMGGLQNKAPTLSYWLRRANMLHWLALKGLHLSKSYKGVNVSSYTK